MKRAVRALIRFVAAGCIVFGGLEFALQILRHRVQKPDAGWWHWLVGSGLVIVGGVLLAFSERLAERLTEDFEE
jgi:hypothetical protein